MNRAPTGPTGQDVADITAKVGGLIRDSSIGVTVTLTTPSAGSFDAASGTYTRTTTVDSALKVYMGPLSAFEVEASAAYQTGDQRVLVMADDVTIAPSVFSWVTSGSEKYSTVTVALDPLGAYYELVVRRKEQK